MSSQNKYAAAFDAHMVVPMIILGVILVHI